MAAVGLRRLFWIGAAVLLGLAALIAIVALLRGELSETDWKILGTLGITLAAGSVCLAGLALVDRRDLVPLGWAAVAVGLSAYAVVVFELWRDWVDDETGVSALLLLGAFVLATTARLLLQRRSLDPLYLAHLVLLAVATAATLWSVWADRSPSDSWAQVLGAVWILAGLTWFLVPVLGRTAGRGGGERVVGRGPGRFEVELGDGEQLVVRSAQ